MNRITRPLACVFSLWFVAAGLVAVAPRAAGQPLADHVPQDALIYVGWAGAEHLGPGFEQSNLKAFLDASSIRELINESLPRLFENLGHQDQDSEAFFSFLAAVGKPMWRHPSAIYFGGMDVANPDMPMPKMAFLCQAGADAKDMVREFNGLLQKYGPPPLPHKVEESDGLVVISIGNVEVSAAKKPAVPISQRKEFVQALAGAGAKQPLAIVYADAEGGLEQIDSLTNQFAPDPAKKKWAQVKEALGLSGLKRIVWAGGFDGKDWATQALVEAPEPRTGLVKALLDTRPLSDEALKAVPATATMAFAGHLDVAGLLGEIRAMVKKIDEDASREFEGGLEQIKQAIGMDLQGDILEALGDEWAMYVDPSVGGEGVLGLTIVNRLKDAGKAEQAFTQLEQLANGAIKEAMVREKIVFSFQTAKQGDLTIHYFAIPVIAPAWAIKDGNLYLALYPQVISGAANHVAKKGPSILQNQAFQAIRQRLSNRGQTQITGFEFTDLPRVTADGYQEILMLTRAWLGTADLLGAKTPALVLPTLSKLKPLLAPSGAVYWSDAGGWHYKSVSPFPGSDFLAMGGMGSLVATQQAVSIGVLLPALAEARRNADRIKSASNLRQIGQAMLLYANENKGAFPGSFGEMLLTQDIAADAFLNPQSKTKPPAGKNAEEMAVWVNQNSDYVYLGAGRRSNVGADVLLAHEKILPDTQYVNILYGDGHVEFVHVSEARRQIDQQAKKKAGQ
jgi:prepilin-type processing-associated H-X9-DG protein